jgi:hypothetical protein
MELSKKQRISLLRAKALAIASGIEHLAQHFQQETATGAFGTNYNTLLLAVRSECPHLAAYLPPPALVTANQGYDARVQPADYTRTAVREVAVHCRELNELLTVELQNQGT